MVKLPEWSGKSPGKRNRTEQRVERWLRSRGLRTLTRNYHCRQGEIDLVMEDQDSIVFVEVRYRSHASHGGALASVDHHKQRRLVQAARHYLARHPHHGMRPCRFDVVAADAGTAGDPEWVKNAFLAE